MEGRGGKYIYKRVYKVYLNFCLIDSPRRLSNSDCLPIKHLVQYMHLITEISMGFGL